MSVLTRFLPLERRTLLSDALLVAAAFGGAALGILTLLSELAPDGKWYEAASVALMVLIVLLCPWVAWRLHGRRTTRSTVPGAAVGVLFSGLVVLAATWVVSGLALGVSWATGSAVSIGMVAFVLTSVAALLLVGWLDTDAVRDLGRSRRHVGLDVARIAATVAALGTAAVALWWASRHPGESPGEVLEFSLAFGVAAATVALGADVSATPVERTASAS